MKPVTKIKHEEIYAEKELTKATKCLLFKDVEMDINVSLRDQIFNSVKQ